MHFDANAIDLGEASKSCYITQELSGSEEAALGQGLLNLQGFSISDEKFKSTIELLQSNILLTERGIKCQPHSQQLKRVIEKLKMATATGSCE